MPGANRTVSYWDVQGGRPFGVQLRNRSREKSPTTTASSARGIGRIDLPAKVRGEGVFVHDLVAAGYAARARGASARIPPSTVSLDRARLDRDPDLVKLIVDGSFVAVIAEAEHAAVG